MNTSQRSIAPESLRHARAELLSRMFDEERWTRRKIATALGLTHTYVGRRLNGDQDVSFEDICMFASLLKMRPVELFKKLELPDLDSNQEPAGLQSGGREELEESAEIATVHDIREGRRRGAPRPEHPATGSATVTPISRGA